MKVKWSLFALNVFSESVIINRTLGEGEKKMTENVFAFALTFTLSFVVHIGEMSNLISTFNDEQNYPALEHLI
jgi:hypothetical protein